MDSQEEKKYPFKKNGLLTKLSVKDIELSIVCSMQYARKDLYVPNVSWGFFSEHEADLVKITKSGYLTEFEIKRSWNDFVADFKKHSYHHDDRISELYYVVPEVMADAAIDYIKTSDKRFYRPGVYSFSEYGNIRMVLGCTYPSVSKMYVEDQFEVARLGVLRYWDKRFKESGKEQDTEQKWISCEEKLPVEYHLSETKDGFYRSWSESKPVLIYLDSGDVFTDVCCDGKFSHDNVIAWMPIPDLDIKIS